MSITDPAELDAEFETQLGRRAPYSMLGDWLLLSGASSEARSLFWGLSAHINVKRDDTEVWPGLVTMARLLHLRKPEQVARYMLELEVLQAVDVLRSQAGLKRRNRYVIHQTPPSGYAGPRSLGEWYALNRAPANETPQQRKEREARFDGWLADVRSALKKHCDEVAGERKEARRQDRPEPPVRPFHAPAYEPRTPTEGGTGRPARKQDAPKSSVPPRKGVRTPTEGGLVPPPKGVEQDEEEQDQQTADALPDAGGQSAGGFARAGASEAAAGESRSGAGGCAASGNDPIPGQKRSRRPKTVRTAPRQMPPGYEAVRAAIPVEIARPGTQIYVGLRRAISDLLRGTAAAGIPARTPEQVIARINARWYGGRGPERSASGYVPATDAPGDTPITNPSSWLAAAILAQDCPDPGCEDGLLLETGEQCVSCRTRRADEAAARDAVLAAAEQLAGETAAAERRRTDGEGYDQAARDAETTIRQQLASAGAWGQLLEHQVARRMSEWREQNPRPVPASAGRW